LAQAFAGWQGARPEDSAAMASPAHLTVANFNALCGKAEGRDKLARFWQYAARAIFGLTQMGNMKAGSRLYWINEMAGNIMKQLASTRRAHRFCKEVPVIQAILQSLPAKVPAKLDISFEVLVERGLDLLQKVTLATFMIIDHIGWLKQMKVLRGGKRAGTGTIQLGLAWFCLSNCLGMLIQAKKLRDVWGEEGKQNKRKTTAENMMKHGFLVVQTAHLSRVYESNDALVGILGMITSTMDVLAQWPEKKVSDEKVSPDAKAMAR